MDMEDPEHAEGNFSFPDNSMGLVPVTWLVSVDMEVTLHMQGLSADTPLQRGQGLCSLSDKMFVFIIKHYKVLRLVLKWMYYSEIWQAFF